VTHARAWALIPMKRFDQAKSRLRDTLSAPARLALAQAMFGHVLAAAGHCDRIEGVAVLTNGSDVAEFAVRAGVHVLHDAMLERPTLGRLIDAALDELPALGATRALVLMGDLPQLAIDDVARMVDALEHADLAIAPDRHGRCTNALALHLPRTRATAFGNPDSYALHMDSARQHGLRVHELQSARLAHDVDTPNDLPSAHADRESALLGALPRRW
jgi:2-phospho-L-lactate/phosphoenolpyruvate guanylyltransferase